MITMMMFGPHTLSYDTGGRATGILEQLHSKTEEEGKTHGLIVFSRENFTFNK